MLGRRPECDGSGKQNNQRGGKGGGIDELQGSRLRTPDRLVAACLKLSADLPEKDRPRRRDS